MIWSFIKAFEDKNVQIFVKINGKNIVMNLNSFDSVIDIKEKILQKEGIPIDVQRLIFSTKELKDYNTLQYYNIQNESTLHLLLTLNGGGGGGSKPSVSISSKGVSVSVGSVKVGVSNKGVSVSAPKPKVKMESVLQIVNGVEKLVEVVKGEGKKFLGKVWKGIEDAANWLAGKMSKLVESKKIQDNGYNWKNDPGTIQGGINDMTNNGDYKNGKKSGEKK